MSITQAIRDVGLLLCDISGASDADRREWCEACGYDIYGCECHDLLHDRPHQDIGTGRPARVFRKRREEPSR